MNLDVVGFGALNMDKLYHVNRIAQKDEESFIIGSTESCGGSAANTIIGLSRLGLECGFIGKVASDREGSVLSNNLQNEDVNTKYLSISELGRSGTVNGYVDVEGERALYVDPGVNDCIDTYEIDMDYINSSKVFHLSSFVGWKYENSIETQKEIVNRISDDVCLSFDPGKLYTDRGAEFLDDFLTRTDILLINSAELNNLIPGDIEDSADEIQEEYSIGIVAVKLGSDGSYVTLRNESHYTNVFDVKCVDTTGAGDAFNAGFLHGYINGDDAEKSALKGNYIASCCVTEYGAVDGIPDIEILREVEHAPVKNMFM